MSNRPSEAERRRRLITRALPFSLIALVAFILGARAGTPGEPEKEAAERFAQAWERKEYAAMYRELNPSSQRRVDRDEFAVAYRDARDIATLRSLQADSAGSTTSREGDNRRAGPGRWPRPSPSARSKPTWTFPSTKAASPGKRASSSPACAPASTSKAGSTSLPAPRSSPPTAPRSPRGPRAARAHPIGSEAIDVSGEVGAAEEEDTEALARQGFTPETPVGITGLEQAFNARLAGKPGGTLLAVDSEGAERTLAEAEPQAGAPVKTTIDVGLQEAAVAALAGRVGGIAVLDTRSGDVRALAGQAFSAPQPPGSTFKMITTTAALQKGVVSLDDEFEITSGANVGGRFIENANGELCGGTFRQAFAESCNADFAPLGPEIGNDAMVATAERFGFNSPPTLYASRILAEVEPAESTIPAEIGEDVDLGVSAIGQGEVLATPLEMASVAQTIGNGGVREPTSIVANKKLRPEAKPVRVMSKKLASELAELMVGVVTGGTGTAGAIPEAQVAGKTGTAELGPKPGEEESEHPQQRKDAWFAAFAPADHAKLAVGVLLIEAEAAGGEVAAPAASAVLSAGL